MTTLTITRGLPSSGKTTWAKGEVAESGGGMVRINRDDFRVMLFGVAGQGYYDCTKEELWSREKTVTRVQHSAIQAALGLNKDIVVDDTNMPVRRCRELRSIATRAGADFKVQSFANVPLDTCLEWNAARPEDARVPEKVIRDMHLRFLNGGLAEVPDEKEPGGVEPVVKNAGLPNAYLFDIDGTLALMGDRNPFDESRVHEDAVNVDVSTVLQYLARNLEDYNVNSRVDTPPTIIVMSARTDGCKTATAEWLTKNGVPFSELHMRAAGDMRKDREVKYDLFNENIRGKYNVLGVFDDRVSVLRMWEALGLTTFRVGGVEGGNF